MQAHELEDLLKDGRRRKSTPDLTLRRNKLREAGLLPTGSGRGANVPHITPQDAARYLVAACAEVSAKDCPTVTVRFMGLKLTKPNGPPLANGAGTFGAALAAALGDWALAHTIKGIHLAAPAPNRKYL